MAQPESLADILAGLTAGTAAHTTDTPVGGKVTVGGIEFTKISDNPFPDNPLAVAILGGPPKPRCRACDVNLDDRYVDHEDNTGLHIMCSEPGKELWRGETQLATEPVDTPVDSAPVAVDVAPESSANGTAPEIKAADPGTPPPRTIDVLRDILVANEAGSARSRQKKIGPSEIGVGCQRALGYKLAGTTEQIDTRVPWAPIQGTAVHAYIADALAADNTRLGRDRWVIEQKVWPDDEISGSGDAFDCDTSTVIDWKIVGDSSITKYRKTMRPEYRIQAHLYGLGHERAGRDVKWVRIVCLSRGWDYGKSWEWTEPYDPEIAINALSRMYGTEDLLRQLDVEANPALWGVVPATFGPDCRYCRFFRPNTPADASGCPGDPDPWATSR